ncbi:hypothetical protein [Actinoplanes subtropicus]|uniref:hypothetical protein n=1 Tax=Actinoplanes subtropicus TaxID=543632 RepID=UPI00068BA29B|nr:hypothetical protein [Actinoplanes subtropicus]
MITLDSSTPGFREILLLAAAWNISPPQVIGRLVDHYYLTQAENTPTRRSPEPSDVAVHRIYAGQRVEGLYHPETQSMTITNGPLSGRVYRSPSGARGAAVTTLNPGVAPNGSGWDFWIVTATGKTLRSIRFGI